VNYLIGVDIGGTTTTLAVGNDRGEILHIADQFILWADRSRA
jgi:predicted NBD/HSP70 family sugar kinase